MRRGPESGGGRNADERSFAEKARDAHAGEPPDWIVALAELADRDGLKGAGLAIGYSGGLVSQVLANKYPGDLGKVEQKTRGALMGATVACPELEVIDRKTCLDWQDKPRAATSAFRVRMYHACRRCPVSKHFQDKEASHGG